MGGKGAFLNEKDTFLFIEKSKKSQWNVMPGSQWKLDSPLPTVKPSAYKMMFRSIS